MREVFESRIVKAEQTARITGMSGGSAYLTGGHNGYGAIEVGLEFDASSATRG